MKYTFGIKQRYDKNMLMLPCSEQRISLTTVKETVLVDIPSFAVSFIRSILSSFQKEPEQLQNLSIIKRISQKNLKNPLDGSVSIY